MRRREFLTLLSIAALQWPHTAFAQSATKRPRIAWLSTATQASNADFIQAFLQGMRELGYDGDHLEILYRFAGGYNDRLPTLAAEIVRLEPDVILATASGPAVAARQATTSIPIVTAALADAVHLGLVLSEARPSGNVTGIEPYVPGLPGKQLELAREIVPSAALLGLLVDVNDPKAPPQFQELEHAGAALELKISPVNVGAPDDLDGAVQLLADRAVDIVIVLQTSMLLSERRRIAMLMSARRLPAIYGYREHVMDGGLISYGVSLRDCFYRTANYVNRILKGAKAGDLRLSFRPSWSWSST
jgi:putative tryptophan/tyrosine transport system substrate-binding protein